MAKPTPEKLAAALRANLKRRKATPGDPAAATPLGPAGEIVPESAENPALPAALDPDPAPKA